MSDPLRWIVTLTYRTQSGPVDVEHGIEELDEILDFVERGPDWNSLIDGKFSLNPLRAGEPLTVEEAEKP